MHDRTIYPNIFSATLKSNTEFQLLSAHSGSISDKRDGVVYRHASDLWHERLFSTGLSAYTMQLREAGGRRRKVDVRLSTPLYCIASP
jgi:hypothetical protein